MKIIADEDMVGVRELFAAFGEVVTLRGRDIGAAHVADADALLVRSVTAVDAALLAHSKVRFVGSATSGADHVDQDFLRAQGVTFASAPGCNANAVVQYVIAALCAGVPDWRGRTVGIVGCGQVGARLYQCLTSLGVTCYGNDPFLDGDEFPDKVSFEEILRADIICLHTPLTILGPYPTWHMFDRQVLTRLKPGTVLLNAGRGAVIDNTALREHLHSGADLKVILDVWESEPAIDIALLHKVLLATPHIAGYSVEGRLAGTVAVRDALCRWLDCAIPAPDVARASRLLPVSPTSDLAGVVLSAWDIRNDHEQMVQVLMQASVAERSSLQSSLNQTQTEVAIGSAFDGLRRASAGRREFSYYRIPIAGDSDLSRTLTAVGFTVGE